MSKIDGNDQKVSALPAPSYGYDSKTEDVASVIKIFNRLADACDNGRDSTEFSHKIDPNCKDLKGLFSQLLSGQPAKESSAATDCRDLIDLLLKQMSATTPKECLQALHQVERVLTSNGVIGRVESTFKKSTTA